MPNLQWFHRNLVVKPSRIQGAGLGLFATEDIPRGTRLGWYRGHKLSRRKWLKSKNDQYMWMMLTDHEKDYYLDAHKLKKTNKLRYVNGCLTPGQKASVNVEAYQKYDKMWYKTTRKIHRGEELIIDYGGDYWLSQTEDQEENKTK